MNVTESPDAPSHFSDRELELLHELAELCGVATRYIGQNGQPVDITPATILFALRELGLKLPAVPTQLSLEDAKKALLASRYSKLIAPTITAIAGQRRNVEVHCIDGDTVEAWVITEKDEEIRCPQLNIWVDPVTIDATTYGTATFELPELPAGWHELHARISGPTGEKHATSTLLVSPQRLGSAERFVTQPATGVMAQLYSVRDRDAWGMGDYRTLTMLGQSLQKLGGADFILVNPMHAAEAVPPVENSPYLPTTRRFTNPIYIRVEDTAEYHAHPELHETIGVMKENLAQANGTSEELNRHPVMSSKLRALYMLWDAGIGNQRREALSHYREHEGLGLEGFATWCENAASEYSTQHGMKLTAEFFAWVQMLCQEQELAAHTALTQHMRIGLMADLAVGVHPGGADSQILADVLAPGASVGAPPDGYNQQGQDWSQPPWHPWKLAEEGYKPWRDMLRTILRSSGGIRVDHVLGLFRLWWIPRMGSPTEGTYVRYDHEALIGALVLEAERADAVVIGEDLGTFEPWVQEYLASRGIMGTSIVWFEGDAHGAKTPDRYRELALTSVTTHDLPPTASYLRGGHIELREKLGVLTRDPAEEYAEDAQWQSQVLSMMGAAGAFAGLNCESYFTTEANSGVLREAQNPQHGRDNRPGGADGLSSTHALVSTGILEGMNRFLSMTPSALRCVSLVDMVGDLRAQNQPGTTHDVYPNWCIPLCDHTGRSVMVEDLSELTLAHDVLAAARGEF
ncbi:4-alpha-glucanotransferase [Corynebacterium sp. 4HC-13]|uniref:4-alpha-glucanotransferase n=1 Tax=Corynebacterium anserum TaxID=2684406 RepID=UPI001A07699C|nr:4-alpha-glucanotransferase [Corynebacterium anserum]MBC2681137.1 4-alpha-glucanotransferase [Corynebacterium anserum]